MKRMMILGALAALAVLAADGRTVTSLGGAGWTCDGETVSVPHTWNAVDACDGPGETVRKWTGSKGGDSVGGLGYLKKRAVYARTLPATEAESAVRKIVEDTGFGNVTHVAQGRSHAWVSDPAAGLPQALTVSLQTCISTKPPATAARRLSKRRKTPAPRPGS